MDLTAYLFLVPLMVLKTYTYKSSSVDTAVCIFQKLVPTKKQKAVGRLYVRTFSIILAPRIDPEKNVPDFLLTACTSMFVWRIGLIRIAILAPPCRIFESSLSNYAPKSTSPLAVLWISYNSVMQLTRWCEWLAHHSLLPRSWRRSLDTQRTSLKTIGNRRLFSELREWNKSV